MLAILGVTIIVIGIDYSNVYCVTAGVLLSVGQLVYEVVYGDLDV